MHPYVGKQADELSLEVSDVVNVLKKMSDGRYCNDLHGVLCSALGKCAYGVCS